MSTDNTYPTVISPGKYLRFPVLFQKNYPILICPVDDFLIFGPRNGLENAESKIAEIVSGEPDGILTFAGSVSRMPHVYLNSRTIINLTASTTRSSHTRKIRIHSIETALRVNASCIAAHINLFSKHAPEMIEIASKIISEAQLYDIPTLGIIYPRGENNGTDNNMDDIKRNDNLAYAEMIAHCISLGSDLGFDIIKTFHTNNIENFKIAINAAGDIPVVIAGGPPIEENLALEQAREAIIAGARGISFGRNVFSRGNPRDFIRRLRKAMLP